MPDSDIIWWFANIVVGTGVILCLVVAVRIIYRGWAFLQVSTTSDWNSDHTAVEHFVALLNEAEKNMVVYDDGNKMEGSIYESQEIVEAVRQKLSENPHFRLSCYFNFGDSTLFTEAFAGSPGVQIEVGQGDRPDDDVHYKIIDGGLKAHLSRHKLSSKKRRCKVIDCSNVPRRLMADVTGVLLQRYEDHATSRGIWVTG